MARRTTTNRKFAEDLCVGAAISPFTASHATRVFTLAVENEGIGQQDRIAPDGACALRVAVYVLLYCSLGHRRVDWKDWELPALRSQDLLEILYSMLESVELPEETRTALERFRDRTSFPMEIWLSNFQVLSIFQAKQITCNMWQCGVDAPSRCTLMTDGSSEIKFSVMDLL